MIKGVLMETRGQTFRVPLRLPNNHRTFPDITSPQHGCPCPHHILACCLRQGHSEPKDSSQVQRIRAPRRKTGKSRCPSRPSQDRPRHRRCPINQHLHHRRWHLRAVSGHDAEVPWIHQCSDRRGYKTGRRTVLHLAAARARTKPGPLLLRRRCYAHSGSALDERVSDKVQIHPSLGSSADPRFRFPAL